MEVLRCFYILESKLKDFKLNEVENNWVCLFFVYYIDLINGDYDFYIYLEIIVEVFVMVCFGSEIILYMVVVVKDLLRRIFGKKFV